MRRSWTRRIQFIYSFLLYSAGTCFDSYHSLSFKIIDKDSSKFDFKLKKLYILIGENLT